MGIETHPEVRASQVREQLARILASQEFGRSERLSRFLSFIVEEALEGRADRIKAYAIAVTVFDRSVEFDPQADPIVRIEAARLRKAIAHYYLTDGRSDPVVITVPKGAYVPHIEPCGGDRTAADHFSPHRVPCADADAESCAVSAAEHPPLHPRRLTRPLALGTAALVALAGVFLAGVFLAGTFSAGLAPWGDRLPLGRQAPASPDSLGIAVLPFRLVGEGEKGTILAEGLGDALIDQLARFQTVRVLGRETGRALQNADDARAILQRMNITHFVEGTVTSDQTKAIVNIRLVNVGNQQVLWSTRATVVSTQDAITALTEVSSQVAMTIAQPKGLAAQAGARDQQGPPPAQWSSYRCVLGFHQYRAEMTQTRHRETRDCLEQAVREAPAFATGLAMLSVVYLDEVRAGFAPGDRAEAAIQRALAAADKATEIDPANVRALQAQMMARFFAGDVVGGKDAGERALRLNRFDAETLGEYGSRLAQAGEWARGTAMLKLAVAQNPANAGYYHGHIALNEAMSGRPSEAMEHLRLSNLQRYPLFHFIKAVALAQMGRLDEASASLSVLDSLQPTFLPSLDMQLRMRNFRPADAERVKAIVNRVQAGHGDTAQVGQ